MTGAPSLPERETARKHLHQIQQSLRFSNARIQFKLLEVLVEAACNGDRIESGWHLAEQVYGDEPGFDGSEVYYNRAKSTLSSLRLSLTRYYSDLPAPPAVRFELANRGFDVRTVAADQDGRPCEAPRPSRAKRVAIWLLAPLCVVCVVSAFWWMYKPAALPAATESRNGSPVLLDRNGEEIEDKTWSRILGIGVTIDPAGQGHHGRGQEELAPFHIRADIVETTRGPDHPAVAVGTFLPEVPQGTGRVALHDGRTTEEIDSLPLPYFPDLLPHPTIHFLGEEGEIANDFHLLGLESLDLDGDGRDGELLLAVAMANYYPAQVLALDASDGLTVLRNYWTAGHVHGPVAVDLNGDGTKEIIVAGTQNDYVESFLAVLKPDGTAGRTPMEDSRKIFEEIANLEENGFVVRFPRTAVSTHPEFSTLRANATVDAASLPGRFVVRVDDVNPIPPRKPDEIVRVVLFDLSPDQESAQVSFNRDYDFYLTVLTRLIKSGEVEDHWGILENESLEDYAAHLAGQVLYWDGTGTDPEWKPFSPEALERYLAD